MRSGAEVIAGLLDRGDRGWVAAGDWGGTDGRLFASLRSHGFVAAEPLVHPTPTCPYCGTGAPYAVGGRVVCDECQTLLDPQATLVWPFRPDAFLAWLAGGAGLTGTPAAVAPGLYQLGGLTAVGAAWACFYRTRAPLDARGRGRLEAYRNALVVYGHAPDAGGEPHARRVLLADVLVDDPLGVRPLATFTQSGGPVRFDPHTGGLWAAGTLLGEVPPGCREYYLLARLAAELGAVVPYADLKRFVSREAGSTDQADEATFCHRLKNRIKARWVPAIDAVLVGTVGGGGYRLRATTAT